MSEVKKMIANVISNRRSSIGMDQQALADYSEVSIATLSNLENSKSNISIVNLEKILDILGLEIVIQIKQK